ncbi:GDP-mannose transporter GONST2 [Tetrabaena socialis]|uniref:GDP-mannose transporter GONST2 n=1 Tax=Tetrabaena socialis TaxID=47790 RepID=A0A2J8A5S3_9CHLO|nr:GDP-mannose transporter GONST2 [Tetrabaena socialis]|eukprot:PNH07869.1 GDP-mannose transporter GONST2 [Tetrabaena socialis]
MWGLRRTYQKSTMAPTQRGDEEELLLAEGQTPKPTKKMVMGVTSVLAAGLCYCCASGSMVLLNKHALANFGFSCPNALLCFQCFLSVVLVRLCALFGLVKLQPLKPDLVRVWFPVNLIFVGMIGSSFYALKNVGVGMVYYNNLLSIPPILGLMWYFGEFETLAAQPALRETAFQVVSAMGGVIGFAISFSSLWFLSQTTATIYSLVGALNKIPVAVVGLVAFNEPTNPKNLASIVIGLFAGVLFTRVKH